MEYELLPLTGRLKMAYLPSLSATPVTPLPPATGSATTSTPTPFGGSATVPWTEAVAPAGSAMRPTAVRGDWTVQTVFAWLADERSMGSAARTPPGKL